MATVVGEVWIEVYFSQGDDSYDAIDSIYEDERNIEGIIGESIAMASMSDWQQFTKKFSSNDIYGKRLQIVMDKYAMVTGDSCLIIWKKFDISIDL